MPNFKAILDDLSDKFDVNLSRTSLATERAFIVVLQKALKLDRVEFIWDDVNAPSIIIYRNGRGRELTPSDVNVGLIVQIKHLIAKYMAIEKADMTIDNLKYLKGGLIKGFIEAVHSDHMKINYNDIPAPAYFYYPVIYQPLRERSIYKQGQAYLFYVQGLTLANIDKKIVCEIILSRTDKRIPELFFKEETDIDVICVKREYDRKKRLGTAFIKTRHMLPFPVIEKYSKEFMESVNVELKR